MPGDDGFDSSGVGASDDTETEGEVGGPSSGMIKISCGGTTPSPSSCRAPCPLPLTAASCKKSSMTVIQEQ